MSRGIQIIQNHVNLVSTVGWSVGLSGEETGSGMMTMCALRIGLNELAGSFFIR
jgi:hypothetical protein